VVASDRGRLDTETVAALNNVIITAASRSLAIVGLAKNAGKTTVVNALLSDSRRRFGLTSLGLDGERIDHLTGLAKPSITPPSGTLLATTRGSLDRSGCALEELEELPFATPLGRVIIGRADETGEAVEISGPTTLAELCATVERLQDLGAEQVLVDGALNRLGSASPRVSDATVLVTGGMVGDTLDNMLETTVAALDLLLLPSVEPVTRRLLAEHTVAGGRALLFSAAGDVHKLELTTAIGEGVTVAREIQRVGADTLYVDGALTQEFVEDLVRILPARIELRLIVRDATALIFPPSLLSRVLRRGIRLEALVPLRVLALAVNPFRLPHPYPPKLFFSAVADAVGDRLPLFDVVGGFAHSPAASANPQPALAEESG